MIYVALLRGINVGGNNSIDMEKLTKTFEEKGLRDVKTYINSENIIFKDKKYDKKRLPKVLEDAIKKDFNLKIKVLLRNKTDFKKMIKNLPKEWENNSEQKSDILFLWENIEKNQLEKDLTITDVDDVIRLKEEILWNINKKSQSKSGLINLAGTKSYKKITIRNLNTVRKIYEIMKSIKE